MSKLAPIGASAINLLSIKVECQFPLCLRVRVRFVTIPIVEGIRARFYEYQDFMATLRR